MERKIPNSKEMDKFLRETMTEVKKENQIMYSFYWGKYPCLGRVSFNAHHVWLDIIPCDYHDQIGNESGGQVQKIFKRDN